MVLVYSYISSQGVLPDTTTTTIESSSSMICVAWVEGVWTCLFVHTCSQEYYTIRSIKKEYSLLLLFKVIALHTNFNPVTSIGMYGIIA